MVGYIVSSAINGTGYPALIDSAGCMMAMCVNDKSGDEQNLRCKTRRNT